MGKSSRIWKDYISVQRNMGRCSRVWKIYLSVQSDMEGCSNIWKDYQDKVIPGGVPGSGKITFLYRVIWIDVPGSEKFYISARIDTCMGRLYRIWKDYISV